MPRIRHYLVDLTGSLGSGILNGPKLAWEGNETAFPTFSTIGRNIMGLGVGTPAWMKEKFPNLPELGAFGSSAFDPELWTTIEELVGTLDVPGDRQLHQDLREAYLQDGLRVPAREVLDLAATLVAWPVQF